MLNFIYQNPTKIIFGKDQIEKLHDELKSLNIKDMLLVYGKKSIKSIGIYEIIKDVSFKLGIRVHEAGGIRANPSLDSVLEARTICLKENIDFILAAGGGSVVDAAKAIALSVYLKADDVWQVFLRKHAIEKALPIGVILTLSGTGSESNGNTVISNDKLNRKRGFGSPLLFPKFAIIDPSYTESVPNDPFLASGIDVMMHTFEQYFSPTDHTRTSDYMCMAIIKSAMESLIEIVHHEDHYQARANLSWAATIALNWILQMGKVGDWASHNFSYPLTTNYGVIHGFALSMILSSWMKVVYYYNPEQMGKKLSFLGEEIFGVSNPIEVISNIENMLDNLGAKSTMLKAGILPDDDTLKSMAKTVTELGDVGNVIKINEHIAYEVFKTSTLGELYIN